MSCKFFNAEYKLNKNISYGHVFDRTASYTLLSALFNTLSMCNFCYFLHLVPDVQYIDFQMCMSILPDRHMELYFQQRYSILYLFFLARSNSQLSLFGFTLQFRWFSY